jgi:hypothetical protein
MKIWPRLLAIFAVTFLAVAAHADTVYTFNGTSINGSAVAFQLSTSSFITQFPAAGFSAAQLVSCTNCSNGSVAALFTPLLTSLTFFDSKGWSTTFLFSSGAFSAPGKYAAWLGNGNLTVSVPEPATIFMGFIALAVILGAIAFRRNAQLQLSRS